MRDLPPVHPGEILLEEFLKPMNISQYRLAHDLNVLVMRINKICRRARGISADTALRLARYFGNSVEFWTGIQSRYDTETARINLGDCLEQEVKIFCASTCLRPQLYQPSSEIRFSISRIINSFCPGSLTAVSRASATSALLLKLF